jgi:hypothetical protein
MFELTVEGMENLTWHCPNLVTLHIRECDNSLICSRTAQAIADNCDDLHELEFFGDHENISTPYRLSEEEVNALKGKLKRLRRSQF